MTNKYTRTTIDTVKSIMEDNFDHLEGPELIKEIRKQVDNITKIIPGQIFNEADKDHIAKKVRINLRKTMEDGSVLVDNSSFDLWYDDRKADIDDIYWNDYRKYLISEGWSEGVNGTINSLDRSTSKILKNCADPLGPPLKRRGMVVGNVQSGKTANYLGLIAKASDAGYKVIIIIAGMLEELRKQTQIRLEESFVGRDVIGAENVGIGTFTKRSQEKTPICMTNRDSDLKKTKIQNSSNLLNTTATAPYVIVVKKNAATLKNLNLKLDEIRINEDNDIVDRPMLLIDDEADNATIDLRFNAKKKKTKKPSKDIDRLLYPEEDPSNYDATIINARIRTILKKFKISTYIGYTATPFANIFISPKTKNDILKEDLFPKNFLYYLQPASTYFGPTEAFIEERNKNFYKEISADESSSGNGILIPHKKEYRLEQIPDSLKECINGFIISTAVKWINGYENEHSSMLVNASSYSETQKSIADVVWDYKEQIMHGLKASSGLIEPLAKKNIFYNDVKKLFKRDFEHHVDCDWKDIKKHIHRVASNIEVVHINRLKTSEKLNYEKYPSGRIVIAVGGYSLSRGLTLKGLVASYYLRTSKMYDTILQMGRWFGYREDYEDLCRIYMTKAAKNDFRFIAGVVKDLNTQITIMQSQEKTPMEFALFVRKHEDTQRLLATANLKRGAAQTRIINDKFGAQFHQNYYFERDLSKINQNKISVEEFLKNIKSEFINNRINENINPQLKKKYAFKEIPVVYVLNLLEKFHFKFKNDEKRFLLEYINLRKQSELLKWDVIIDSRPISSNTLKSDCLNIGGFEILPVDRDAKYEENIDQKEFLQSGTSKRSSIVSPKIYELTLSKKDLEIASNYSQSNQVKPFKGILETNRVPKLYITIMNLNFTYKDKLNENNDPETEEFLNHLPEIYTLSYILPPTSIKEKKREVLVNTDIDNPFLNTDYFEDDLEDDGDD